MWTFLFENQIDIYTIAVFIDKSNEPIIHTSLFGILEKKCWYVICKQGTLLSLYMFYTTYVYPL